MTAWMRGDGLDARCDGLDARGDGLDAQGDGTRWWLGWLA
jgi:hypothetical protein